MKRVLFVSATSRINRPYLDPSVRYRCFNPAFALNSCGYLVDVISFKEFTLEVVKYYNVIIFHRPSYEKKLLDAIELAKSEKVTLIADYDDLIFSSKHALESSIYKSKRATKEETLNIFNNNEKALKLFNNFTVSTGPLKDKVLETIADVQVTILPNALNMDIVNRSKFEINNNKEITQSKKVISYLSGTASHDKDFQTVKPVLIKLLKKYQNSVELLVVGPLNFDINEFRNTTHLSYVDYENLSKIISKTDINIAPLEINNFTDCKSGLKFFESGLFKIPSVVTPTTDMRRFNDSKGILYATTEKEWYSSLEKLITNSDFYQKISINTYNYVLERCTMNSVVGDYIKLLDGEFQ